MLSIMMGEEASLKVNQYLDRKMKIKAIRDRKGDRKYLCKMKIMSYVHFPEIVVSRIVSIYPLNRSNIGV